MVCNEGFSARAAFRVSIIAFKRRDSPTGQNDPRANCCTEAAVRFRLCSAHFWTPGSFLWRPPRFSCEDRRTSAAGRFTGGTKNAEPMEIPHVFRFSSLSDSLAVSTLHSWQQAPTAGHCRPNGPRRSRRRRAPTRRRHGGDTAAVSGKIRRRGLFCARGAASRCDAALVSPVFWHKRQILAVRGRIPPPTPPRIAPPRRAWNRVSQNEQSAGLTGLLVGLTKHRDQ
jgi:hypothetical protein